jgi:NAD(P)-dependent dehydrogenase (short-subunit alcohol dehydrogenase family)
MTESAGLELAGKVTVITGAADGIGRALADGFAAAGARLVLADVDAAKVGAVGKELAELGTDVLTVGTDVSKAEDVRALRDATLERFGTVHVLCNNAGVMGPAGNPLWELPLHEWERVMSVNLWGVLNGIQAFLPTMLASGQETHILNTASMAGVSTGSTIPEYIVSKHAVVALSEVLQAQLTDRGARVGITVLCPSAVRTDLASREHERLSAAGHGEPWAVAPQAPGTSGWGLTLTPTDVAAVAIAAVRARRLFAFTHPGSRGRIEARLRPIFAALEIDEPLEG